MFRFALLSQIQRSWKAKGGDFVYFGYVQLFGILWSHWLHSVICTEECVELLILFVSRPFTSHTDVHVSELGQESMCPDLFAATAASLMTHSTTDEMLHGLTKKLLHTLCIKYIARVHECTPTKFNGTDSVRCCCCLWPIHGFLALVPITRTLADEKPGCREATLWRGMFMVSVVGFILQVFCFIASIIRVLNWDDCRHHG